PISHSENSGVRDQPKSSASASPKMAAPCRSSFFRLAALAKDEGESFARMASDAFELGHNEYSVTEMRGTEGCSRYAIPLRVIPERGQVPENVSHPPNKEAWHVLQQHPSRSYHANDPSAFWPEPALIGLPEPP